MPDSGEVRASDIAIVGMALRVPGANDVATFWSNLRNGVESIVDLSVDELVAAGVAPEVAERADYVRRGAPLDRMEWFDAEFFGFSPKDAAIMDPQHRHFLEVCWEALEDAGHVPDGFDGAIGVFAGSGTNTYYASNILSNRDLVRDVGTFLLRHTGNDKDFLSTRVSYLLDLTGPSVNVQTACSTSLVATHLACQHLLSGECDLALAGGVTIELPHRHGYRYHDGEILSPDGRCRAFDHRAAGTVFGSGAGVVVLRRLEDALADGDQVHAVIRASAVNNDGSRKVGYLAPSVDGQAACIAEALAVADVSPADLGYVECHGTGTAVGDPIEVTALTQAFRAGTDAVGVTRIGSVKSNIGHLDTAAGVASLVKATLALREGAIPPSLHVEAPHPDLQIETSPFRVDDRLHDWPRTPGRPRLAGVNSLGVGGTNSFVVLEEAPGRDRAPSDRRWHLLVVSGRTRAALDDNVRRLAEHLEQHPELDLADVAFTLAAGRRGFAHRRVLAARDLDEAATLLRSGDPRRSFVHDVRPGTPASDVVFLFPGGGAQHASMARGLVDDDPAFAAWIERGLARLQERHGIDLRPLLRPEPGQEATASRDLERPSLQLPAIFLVEHALARVLLDRGIRPAAMLGHSVGENTAACVAGTIAFDDALDLVVLRGQLMDRAAGGMVVVPLPAADLEPLLAAHELDLAAVNAPDLCVASGPLDRLDALEAQLRAEGIEAQRVRIEIAAHSRLLDAALPEFERFLRGIELRPPTIPWVSNRTGTWITTAEATDPAYWVAQLRNTVRFADGVATLAAVAHRAYLEVGPGKALSSLVKACSPAGRPLVTIPAMRHAEEPVDDAAALLTALGRLWAAGAPFDPASPYAGERRRRVGLPTYAFQHEPYFIAPATGQQAAQPQSAREPDEQRWRWEPVWRRRDVEDPEDGPWSWLVLADDLGIADDVVARLRSGGHRVVVARIGDTYRRLDDGEYRLAPESGRDGYDQLLADLARRDQLPDRVLHLALLAADERCRPGSSFFHRNQERGFYSLLFFCQAWTEVAADRPLHVVVGTAGMQRVPGDAGPWWPDQATVLGPARVAPRELAGMTVSCVDMAPTALVRSRRRGRPGIADPRAGVVDALCQEAMARPNGDLVVWRGGDRHVQDVRRARPSLQRSGEVPALPEGAVVLVTGGLGGVGGEAARAMHERYGARLVLVSRRGLPERDRWPSIIETLDDDHPTVRGIRLVADLEAAGAEVLVAAADVTDVEQVRQVTRDAVGRFGRIDALVHAAGVLHDGLMAAKEQAEVDDVLAPKVSGTLVLADVLREQLLRLVVLCSSTSTWTAPPGQVDYVAANAFCDHWAAAQDAPGRRVVSIDWGAWHGLGMAAASVRSEAEPGWSPLVRCDHPWFDERHSDRRLAHELFSSWTTAAWFLDEHRTGDGAAVLPGAAYPELLRAARAETGATGPFAIEDLVLLRPIAAPDDAPVHVRTRLVPTTDGTLVEVHERVYAEGGGTTWALAATARLAAGAGSVATGGTTAGGPDAAASGIELDAIRARCARPLPLRTRQEDHLRFGPRWRCVREAVAGTDEALLRLELPDAFAADVDSIHLHPALVDLGTGGAIDLVPGYLGDRLWAPVGATRWRIHGRIGRSAWAWVRLRSGSESSGVATFDVAIADPDGRLLLAVDGFTIRRLDGALLAGAAERAAAPVAGEVSRTSPAERSLARHVELGIRADEGRRALVAVLDETTGPRVVVTPIPLPDLVADTDRAAAGALAGASTGGPTTFARPVLRTQFVAPRDELERQLAAMWCDLLGLDEVGVDDDFFDLGGHSLIAVRLFARIRQQLHVDLPMSVLFEAPTVGACAALVRTARGTAGNGDGDGDNAATPAVSGRTVLAHTHLVAMHEGGDRAAAPFFLVAGMFGNVLNLRHLANQIGPDRPFYGLQARGLFGDEPPHETFEEMAADYLAEIRQVQPHGPYLLGGFSGGGIAAVEMARQLALEGEETTLLALIDTPIPSHEVMTWQEKLRFHRQHLRSRGWRYLVDSVERRIAWERTKRRRARGGAGPAADDVLHSTEIEQAFYRALSRYELRHVPGTVTLYRPHLPETHVLGPGRMVDEHRRFLYEDNGWGRYADHVEVHVVPGDHDSMVLEPNVRVLAARMRDAIRAAEAAARAGTRTATTA